MSRNPIVCAMLRAAALAALLLLCACPGKGGQQAGGGQAQAPKEQPAADQATPKEPPAWAKNPDRAVVAFIGDFRGFQDPCG